MFPVCLLQASHVMNPYSSGVQFKAAVSDSGHQGCKRVSGVIPISGHMVGLLMYAVSKVTAVTIMCFYTV